MRTARAAAALMLTLGTPAWAAHAELSVDHPAPPAPSDPLRDWPLPGRVHPAVQGMPREAEASIASVAAYLRARTHDGLDRAKAVHDWIATRIAFDADDDAHPSPALTAESAAQVFAERRAVCQGYAHLFEALAQAAGERAVYIAGEARVLGRAAPVDHAWNAVFVEGRWQLVDVTWDAGAYLDGRFVARFGTDYLFAPPEVFGLTHRPYADTWQLRRAPLPRGAFLAAPLLLPAFFAHGLRWISPAVDGRPVVTDGALELVVDRRTGGHLSARAQAVGDATDLRCAVEDGDRVVARCSLPPGRWQVTIYYSPSTTGAYLSVGALPVSVSPH